MTTSANNQPSFINLQQINLQQQLASIAEYWAPKEVGKFNDMGVNIAKLKGEYEVHEHGEEDKLFYVLSGTLLIEMSDKTVSISAGECVIIPKGIAHKPIAPEETCVMFFVPKG